MRLLILFSPISTVQILKEYKSSGLIVPSIIDLDSHSYDALKISMAKKYNCDISEIENKRKKIFDKDYKESKLVKGKSESYEYIHLMLLYVHAEYKKRRNNKSALESLSKITDYAISQIRELGLDKEYYWIEYIQFNIEMIDLFWKMSDYDNMHKQLIKLENMLLYKYEITDC